METLCGAKCESCGMKKDCCGCPSPFGGNCLAAEYLKIGGRKNLEEFKKQLMAEFNFLGVEGLPEITELYCLCGAYVNLEYPMPSGEKVKLLNDKNIYLGTQVEPLFSGETDVCYGLVAGMDFLLVCEYGCDGINPDILVYKKR